MPRQAVHRPRRLLVTGGAGFIGSNFIRHVLEHHPDASVTNLDSLSYAGSRRAADSLTADHPGRHVFVRADIRDAGAVAALFAAERPDTVVHFAAESHVDRSIDDPLAFVETNVVGTVVLLRAAREAWRGRDDVRFHHVSTDEVYGSLGPEGRFTEASPYDPSSPYSASKAASDHFVRAWSRTYGLPATISNSSNNYGPRQYPEKLVPLMILAALAERPLPVYGDGANVRDWLHVEDHARALWEILTRGRPGATYNVGADNELSNLQLVRRLCGRLDAVRPRRSGVHADLITFVPDRPGHDFRYAVDSSRLREELGWAPLVDFDAGLDLTIRWYLDNREWTATMEKEGYGGGRLGLGDRRG